MPQFSGADEAVSTRSSSRLLVSAALHGALGGVGGSKKGLLASESCPSMRRHVRQRATPGSVGWIRVPAEGSERSVASTSRSLHHRVPPMSALISSPRPRPGPLRRHHRRSPAPGGPPNAAKNSWQAPGPRSTASEAPVACSVRLDGDPQDDLIPCGTRQNRKQHRPRDQVNRRPTRPRDS